MQRHSHLVLVIDVMAALSCLVRRSLAKSFDSMRCVVFGSYHVRLCHSEGKDSDPDSKTINPNADRAEVEDDRPEDETFYDSDEGIDDKSISDRILTAALQFVPEHGWSAKAIAEGAKAEGYSGMAEGIFPKEGGDLVLHFINMCNLDLGDYLAENSRTQEENRKKIGQSDFIKNAVEVRLRMIIPYMESWPQAMGLMAYPSNVPDAFQSAANMVDDIWYHSNDNSTDINWYLKRSSLATIYGLTELYMTCDKSQDFEDTWKFLDRRFQDIRTTGNIRNSINKVGEDVSTLACSAVTLVVQYYSRL